MATTSFLSKEDMKVLLPDEDIMLKRFGRDQPSYRRQFAPLTTLPQGEMYVEEGEGVYLDAATDMPETETAPGEVLGNVDVVRYEGDQTYIPRMTHGITVEQEDLEKNGGAEKLQRLRNGLVELFDLQADLQFLNGAADENGNQITPGIFNWLDANIDTSGGQGPGGDSQVIDCSQFDTATDLDDIPANIIVQEAYGRTTGEYADTTWELALGQHDTWALWNGIQNNDGVTQMSHWVANDNDQVGVGVRRTLNIQPEIGLPTAPDANDTLRFDVEYPDDTMYLIPEHGGDFYELYEQARPTGRDDPVPQEGFRERHEFRWRAKSVYNMGTYVNDDGEYPAMDVIRLDNVSSLF
jgi:hypothetical protein